VVVHSALPPKLTAAVDAILLTARVGHVSHGVLDPVATASDPRGFVGR
jgi:hypothetical protein